jgi:hypothetical protein
MLPVHKSKGSKVVTHFIAIQKDISVVKKVRVSLPGHGQTSAQPSDEAVDMLQDTNVHQWTPPECAMYVTLPAPAMGLHVCCVDRVSHHLQMA